MQARNEGRLTLFYYHFLAGWWFGTFFMFPYIGNNHPNWRTHIFQRGWNHQPARFSTFSLMGPVIPDWQTCSSCKQNWPIGSTGETKLGMSQGVANKMSLQNRQREAKEWCRQPAKWGSNKTGDMPQILLRYNAISSSGYHSEVSLEP